VKRYSVTISYRPHYSSLRREEVTYEIIAPNKTVAAVRAGWRMYQEERHHVAESITITIEGRAGNGFR
jgi:hypothetical protein